jgi:hypothetical protein
MNNISWTHVDEDWVFELYDGKETSELETHQARKILSNTYLDLFPVLVDLFSGEAVRVRSGELRAKAKS